MEYGQLGTRASTDVCSNINGEPVNRPARTDEPDRASRGAGIAVTPVYHMSKLFITELTVLIYHKFNPLFSSWGGRLAKALLSLLFYLILNRPHQYPPSLTPTATHALTHPPAPRPLTHKLLAESRLKEVHLPQELAECPTLANGSCSYFSSFSPSSLRLSLSS